MKRQHYIQYEIFYILLITFSILALTTWINVESTIADYQRLGLTLEYWKPLVWEISSQFLTILLIPCIILIERYFPLNKKLFLKNITFHGLFTIPFSLFHVIGMVLLRKLYYLSIGDEYNFGKLSNEFFYEYRKDLFTYFEILAIIYLYRLSIGYIPYETKNVPIDENKHQISTPDHLLIKKLGKEFIVKITDIDWIEAAGNYMNLMIDNRIYPLRETMSNLEKKLPSKQFVRIHRSTMVNLNQIKEIQPLETGDFIVVLNTDKVLRLSRRYRENVKKKLF